MKKCDNSTRKIHISSNFLLSISLLIMFDTLLSPSLHCYTSPYFTNHTSLHFATIHHTSPNYTSLHLSTLHFLSVTLHYPSPYFTQPHFTTLRYTSPHFIQLYFTTLRYTSPHFIQLYFTTLIYTSLPLSYTSLPSHLALCIYISYRSI
jgi:hypothetical protein